MLRTLSRLLLASTLLAGLAGCTEPFNPDPNTFYPCEVGQSECVSGYSCEIIPDPTNENAAAENDYVSVCLQECASDAACPSQGEGWACVVGEELNRVDGDETGFCAPEIFLLDLGCSPGDIQSYQCICEVNEDCVLDGDADDEAWCIEGVDGANVCTVACDGDGQCGEGGGPGVPPEYDCMNTGLSGDRGPEAVCMPPSARTCQPCNADEHCGFAGGEAPEGAPERPDSRCVLWDDPFGNAVGICGHGAANGGCPPETPALVTDLETVEGDTVDQCFPTEAGPDGCGGLSETSINLGHEVPR